MTKPTPIDPATAVHADAVRDYGRYRVRRKAGGDVLVEIETASERFHDRLVSMRLSAAAATELADALNQTANGSQPMMSGTLRKGL